MSAFDGKELIGIPTNTLSRLKNVHICVQAVARRKRGYDSYFMPVLRVHNGLEFDRDGHSSGRKIIQYKLTKA